MARLDAPSGVAAPAGAPRIPGAHEQVLPVAENLFKSLLAIGLLLGSFQAAGRIAAAIDGAAGLPAAMAFAIKWGAVGVLAIVNGVLVTAMIALAHDAVHRVLFRSAFWNELWGSVLSALSLVPFNANRQFHLTHHGYAHQPGLDPESAMHDRPFLHAATVGSFIGIREQYRIFLRNLLHITDRKVTGRAVRDVLSVLFGAAFYCGLVPALGIPLTVSVLPMLLVFPLVFSFRALSDHYGIPSTERAAARVDILDADAETWTAGGERRQREVSGWVILTSPWIEWLWSHVNYHEVHHKYPYLSHRYLPQVFEATRGKVPYLVVRGYWRSVVHLRRCGYYGSDDEVRPFHVTSGPS
jgi:fatty acid desaturase